MPQTVATQTVPAVDLRLLIASSIGTAIEWYDFFLYALIAPVVFDAVFFPRLDKFSATLAVLSSFAVGFVARPLGGIVFGHIGDRSGRGPVMVYSMALMGGASTVIGLLPAYATIGTAAPALLVGCRFLQGFALGGESVAATVLTLERVPLDRRGLYTSIIQAAGPAGTIGASLIVALLNTTAGPGLHGGLWRIPFLLSAVLLLIGVRMRRRCLFPPSAPARGDLSLHSIPLTVVLQKWRRPTAVCILLCLAETTYYYLATIFTISFGVKTLGLSQPMLNTCFLAANAVALFTVPWLGSASDRIGRRRLIITGLVCAAVFILPFFKLIETRNQWLIAAAMIGAAGVIHPIIFSAEASFVPELFERNVRMTGAMLGKQIGTAAGGGLAPLLATALAHRASNFQPVVWYFVAISLAAIVAVLRSGAIAAHPGASEGSRRSPAPIRNAGRG